MPDAAEAMAEVFTEVVIAPSYTAAASTAFAQRPNLRLVAAPMLTSGGLDVRPLPGGALIQDRDTVSETRADWKVVSSREPTMQEWADLELAWTIAWRVKSNTIVLVKEGATVGVGAGQMSRVDSSGSRRGKPATERRERCWPPMRSSPSPTRSRWPPTRAAVP
jgi:phosphoribosylaminoimidazolecarboxamide formyltransferase/IMP cyclohydrolase